jgi:lyso-ornithine lipid O-acyltransferase
MTAAARLRVIVRLAAFLPLLLGSVALFNLHRLLPGPNPWPRRFLGAAARLAGAELRIVGRPAGARTVFLANHVSWLDILVLAGASGAAFVAHRGLANHPVLKWLCDMNDTVFIARDEPGRIAEQVAQVRAALTREGALAIFPEGTTSDGSGLLPFKSALLSALDPAPAEVVVQPVWLDYGPHSASLAWYGDEPGLANLLRVLGRGERVPIALHFLEPFDPRAAGSRKAIAAQARARIEAAIAAAGR